MGQAGGTIRKEDLVKSNAASAYDELKESAKALVIQLEALNKEVSKAKTTTTQTSNARAKSNKILTEEEKVTKQLKAAKEKLLLVDKDQYKELIKTRKAITDKTAALRKSTSATKTQEKASKGLTGTFGKLLKSMVAFIGVRMFIQQIKDTFNLVKTLDSLRFSMKKIVKSAFDVGVSFRFMLEISRDFGVELISTTERWIKFLAAAKQSGVTLRDTQNIFRSMTKAASVLGLKTDELRGVYLALEQMLSKGKVTTEELRRQLGERLPGAMGIMAASLGVTISELDKMLKKGEVLSAEVLPNFARAVELAYGIENVKKVDTLVASQNRLTTAWQSFVSNILSDNSNIVGAFNRIGNSIEHITKLLSAKAFVSSLITESKKEIEDSSRYFAGKKAEKELGIDIISVKKTINTLSLQLQKTYDKKRKDEIVKTLSKLLKQEKDYSKRVNLLRKETAFKNIKELQKQYDDGLEKNKKNIDNLQKLKSKSIGKDIAGGLGLSGLIVSLFGSKDELKKAEESVADFANLTAELEIARGLVEESSTVKPKKGSSSSKKIRDIFDLQNKIRAKELQSQIEANKKNIDAEESSFTLKKDLLYRNLELEKQINDLILEDKIDAINKKADAEIKAAGGSKTSRGIELEKERNQNILLLSQDLSAKKIELVKKTESELEKIRKIESNKIKEQLEEQAANLQIAKDKELAIARSTSKTKKELAIREADINLKYQKIGNEQLIEIYTNLIEHLKTLGIETKKLEKILEGLKNKSFTPNLKGEEAKFRDIIDVARQFNDAMSGLFDAISARKIENIDAEINAEEKKYDRLLELAQGDKAQQESIQREKDAALAKLEKKRLKEEQKAAKQRKASALIDIAINTAVGISAATKTGIFGLWAVPIIAALGALQAAAVLAQPIPKFKEGGTMEYDGKALINDGREREYVERGGIIFSTPIKNAVVDLKQDDIIHKDFNSLMNASIMTSLANDNKNLDSSKLKLIFDNNYDNLENTISKSLRKAKFNNNIRLNGFDQSQQDYRNSLSRWNS